MKVICMPLTVYALLNFLLINNEKEIDVLFIFHEKDKYLNEIAINMQKNGMKIKKIKYFQNIVLRTIYYKIKSIFFNFKNKNKIIYGQDHLIFVRFLKNKIFLLEDGIANYKEKPEINEVSFLKKIIRYLLIGENKESFGRSKNVEKIYLTGLLSIPEDIISKVELISLEDLWQNKTEVQKKNILKIFGKEELFQNTNYKEKIIFLSQPFFESGILTLKQEIDLYKEILKKYKSDEIIIKPHPREEKNYFEIFPEYEIMSAGFPFELIKLSKIKFKKVITIFSTAALNLGSEQEVEFLGTEIHSEILKKCGKITKETILK